MKNQVVINIRQYASRSREEWTKIRSFRTLSEICAKANGKARTRTILPTEVIDFIANKLFSGRVNRTKLTGSFGVKTPADNGHFPNAYKHPPMGTTYQFEILDRNRVKIYGFQREDIRTKCDNIIFSDDAKNDIAEKFKFEFLHW